MHETDGGISRRTFVSVIGGSAALGFSGTAGARSRDRDRHRDNQQTPPGTSGTGNDEELPISARGEGTHVFKPAGDVIVHEHTFESEDLKERYGDPVIELEPERIPRELAPDELKDGGTTTRRTDESHVVGTIHEHKVSEQKIREEAREESGVSAQDHYADELPLYHYESSSDAEDARDDSDKQKQLRKAPINLAWENDEVDSAEWVKNHYEDDCNWNQYLPLPEKSRYINFDGRVVETDEHIMDRLDPMPFEAYDDAVQAHIRTYEIDHDRFSVVGQAHIDPPDHNQICRYTGVLCNSWYFDTARDTAKDCWLDEGGRSAQTHSMNTSSEWDTHDGMMAFLWS